MKTAIRVWHYIIMTVSVIAAAILLFSGCTVVALKDSDLALFAGLGLALLALIPLIACIIVNDKLNEARCKADMKVWGIVAIVLCGIVSGVLILCLPETAYKRVE